jgi:ACS family hexuronate transporter-like MFS transporter
VKIRSVKIPSLRWWIAGLLFIETLLAYLDLQELSVLAPVLLKQLGIGNRQYGFITQSFLVAYTITFLLGGMVVDRLGVRRGLGFSLFLWSAANAMHALAHNGTDLAIYRFILGLFYPGAFLAAARAVSEWYPEQERAFVYGIYVSGATVGSIIAYPMVVTLSTLYSWRAPFVVTGVAGLLLSIVWLLIYRRPEEHRWITERERQYVSQGRPKDTETAAGGPWKLVIPTRVLWAVGIGRFIGDSVWMFYVLWLAKFLVDSQGLSIAEMGRVGWIPFLFADFGSIGGGWISGLLIRRGMPTRRARYAVLTAVTVVRSLTFVLIFRYTTPVLIGLISIFVMCTTAWQVNLSVMLVDKFPARAVATAAGITTSFGTFSTVFFTGGVAWVVQRYSYRPVFFLLSFLSVFAYAVVRLILHGDTASQLTKMAAVQSSHESENICRT